MIPEGQSKRKPGNVCAQLLLSACGRRDSPIAAGSVYRDMSELAEADCRPYPRPAPSRSTARCSTHSRPTP
jgi:hypothetical protein